MCLNDVRNRQLTILSMWQRIDYWLLRLIRKVRSIKLPITRVTTNSYSCLQSSLEIHSRILSLLTKTRAKRVPTQNEGHDILVKISDFLILLHFYHFLMKNKFIFLHYYRCRHVLFVFYPFWGIKETIQYEFYKWNKRYTRYFIQKIVEINIMPLRNGNFHCTIIFRPCFWTLIVIYEIYYSMTC